MNLRNFFAELKRRNVYKVAVAYVVVAWLIIQVATQVFPFFEIPNWAIRLVVLLLILGFPVALVLSWAFEITPEGIKLESEVPPNESISRKTGRKLIGVTIVLAIIAAGLFALRFINREGSMAATRATPATTAAAVPEKSIAVLPFANESGNKDEQYFSDGLSEDLITALAQFAGLKVINRDSSFQFRSSTDSIKTIAEKLGVAHLLEGSVQRMGDEVRISAELVIAADGSTLWSEHYDRPYKDLFALQDDITKAVAGVLKAKLLTATNSTAVEQTDRPPSGNLAAYDAYLQGQFYDQRDTEADFQKAITQFTSATQLDPHYAAAYAAMADTWTKLAGYFLSGSDKPGAYAKARDAAETALRLNPDLAAAHTAYAALLVNADFDWSAAEAQNRRALELAPDNALATLHLSTNEALLGHLESAVKLAREALAGNSLQAFWTVWLASYQAALGRLDEAEASARRAVALQPQAPLTHRELTAIEVLRGDAAAALTAARNTPPGRNQDIAMAWALQIGSDRAAADAALRNLIDKDADNAAYQIAEVYASRKDPDDMFKWLDRAWANRDDGIQYLLYDPFILRYKDDPRFDAFCQKVGLPTTTEAKPMP